MAKFYWFTWINFAPHFWSKIKRSLDDFYLAYLERISALSRVGDQTIKQNKNKEEKGERKKKKEER